MRYLLIGVLVVLLAMPAVAAKPMYALVYNLTFNSDGTITGTFGGIPVSGTWADGTWTLTIDGKTFATGTYSCSNGSCTFTGSTLMGNSTSFTFASAAPGTASGQIAGVFRNNGAWVSAVTKWASANLTGVRRGQVISAAAHNQQLLMQANHTNNGGGASSSQGSANSHGNNAGGNGKGKGH